MNFLVLSRGAMKTYSFLAHNEQSMVISIYTPNDRPLRLSRQDKDINGIKFVLPICFDDCEDNDNGQYSEPITEDQARTIHDFVLAHINEVDTIICHCDAGVSRSAGVAAALSKALNDDDFQFFNGSMYCPNMTCYRKVLDSFNKINNP